MEQERVVAVDLGGTKTSACFVTRQGVCGPKLTSATRALAGANAVLDQVAGMIDGLVARDGDNGVLAVGVGAAGVIDPTVGTVVSATEAFATDWVGTDVVGGLRRRLNGLPVSVDNDVNTHAVGEAWLGAGRGYDRVLVTAVGTGVGGALVVDGHPVHGPHHFAGEMGHVPVPGAEHLRCACGRLGHVEAISAGPGLLRHFHHLGGTPTFSDARQVIAAACEEDGHATRAISDSATALGRCLAGIATVIDPDVIVVGGGMAAVGAGWWQSMEGAVREEVVDALSSLPIRSAELGDRSALVGSARLAWIDLDERATASGELT